MDQTNNTKARDISHPIDSLEFDGKTYKAVFDLNCFRVAEDVYELYYRRDLNFGEIAKQLASGKIGAVMAVMYGALTSGGQDIPWEEFSSKFRLTDIPGVKEKIIDNVVKALPEVDPKDPQAAPTTM